MSPQLRALTTLEEDLVLLFSMHPFVSTFPGYLTIYDCLGHKYVYYHTQV